MSTEKKKKLLRFRDEDHKNRATILAAASGKDLNGWLLFLVDEQLEKHESLINDLIERAKK